MPCKTLVPKALTDVVLSLTSMTQRLKVKYIFAGFEMGPIDPHDAIPIRVLKSLLRSNIPELRPRLQEAIEGAFEKCLSHSILSTNGKSLLIQQLNDSNSF